jgi:DNA polymerase I-like protein with 3'-5' exonuclease and polymerase domains
MSIITIDFETYYAKGYSLGKMTTEEYIRDSRFEVIGVAVQVNGDEPVWFSGTKEKTKAFLDGFKLDEAIVIAHNAMFDMAILNWQFDIRPKRIVDTLSMARALHSTEVGGSLAELVEYYELGEKGTEVVNALGKRRLDFDAESLARYGEYCKNDVALTYKLCGVLGNGFPRDEFKLIDLTIRMFTEPKLELDVGLLGGYLTHIRLNRARFFETYAKDDLMSNPKFAALLRELGVEPPMKISPTTGKETYAFSKNDEGFKELLDHERVVVQSLAAARLGAKSTIEETRTERFIELSKRGAMPIPLRYYAAHTGRWGGDDKVNMQNLPRKSILKNTICAPDGYRIIDSDSSQIEARTLAWLAQQDDLVEFFEKNNAEIAAGVEKKYMQYDPYKIMASQIYGKPVGDITDDERFVGKTTILGAGYGMGATKFRAQLKTFGVDMPQEECERIIQVYRETYPKIPGLWRQANRVLNAIMDNKTTPLGRKGVLTVKGLKGIRLPNGLYIKYPNIRAQTNSDGKEEMVYDTKRGKTIVANRIYGGKVIENVCQALARIVIGEQMLRINRKYPVVMTVHDAIACLVPEGEVETGQEFVELCMRLRPEWAPELPLNCESGYGLTYGEC